MMSKAKDVYFAERLRKRDPSDKGSDDNFLIEQSKVNIYADRSKQHMEKLKQGSNYNKPRREVVAAPSRLRMFEEHNRIKSDVPLKDMLPRGVSLRESLKVDQEYTKSWHQPRLVESISVPMEYRCHSLKNFDREQFLADKYKLDIACSNQQRNHWNSDIFPCFIQTIKITGANFDNLMKAKNEGKDSYTFDVLTDHPDLIEVPIGYTVSDGSSESLTVLFPWERIPENTNESGLLVSHTLKFTFTKLPQEVLSFLQGQQIKITDQAESLSGIMNDFLEDFYGISSNIKFVDIASIAIAAGCRMNSLDLFSLSCVTLGAPFPWGLDYMDQLWIYDFEDQPREIFVYMSSKLVVLWEIYQVLMGCLLRNLFADPDIALYALRLSEDSFISWYNSFICRALLKAKPHAHYLTNVVSSTVYGAKSRAEMLLAVKDGDNYLLEQLSDLFVNVPVVACGGARFLHHVRNCFFKQFSVLEYIHLPSFLGEQPRPRDNLLDNKYELMYKREYVIDDSGSPARGWDLLASPQFASSIYHLSVDASSDKDIVGPRRQYDREVVPAICEWARLNPGKLDRVFTLLNNLGFEELKRFWVEKIRCYDYMRGCYFRMYGHRLGVRALDLVTAKREDHSKSLLVRSAGVNPSRTESARISMFDGLADGDNDDRVGLHQSVYDAVPGFNNKRNREWADKKTSKRLALKDRDPNWLTDKEFKKMKRTRVIEEVQQQMSVPDQPSTSSMSSSSSSGSRGYSVRYQRCDVPSRDLPKKTSNRKHLFDKSRKCPPSSSLVRDISASDLRHRLSRMRSSRSSGWRRSYY